MKPVALLLSLTACALTACAVPIPMAPGAERVRVTRNPADVVSCKPLGNYDAERNLDEALARNHTVGLGGDTLLDTTPGDASRSSSAPITTGVIYRCAR